MTIHVPTEMLLAGNRKESYWLVERGTAENHVPTIWLKSIAARRAHDTYERTWTERAADAERYGYKEMAERIALEVGLCRATEHIFL